MAGAGRLPAIEERMLSVLDDGRPHDVHEMFRCLWDEQSKLATVATHITHLRDFLRPLGGDILLIFYKNAFHYQRVIVYKPESAP
jgi:hypothetical protein